MTQDTYQGTLDNPLSQNLYSYVMNNPVNMWDPSGNVPSWVGDEWHDEITYYDEAETEYKAQFWFLIDEDYSYGSRQEVGEVRTPHIIETTYSQKLTEHWYYNYWVIIDTAETFGIFGPTLKTFTEKTTYQWTVKISAAEIADENKQKIADLGSPPTNSQISNRESSEERTELDYLLTGTASEYSPASNAAVLIISSSMTCALEEAPWISA